MDITRAGIPLSRIRLSENEFIKWCEIIGLKGNLKAEYKRLRILHNLPIEKKKPKKD